MTEIAPVAAVGLHLAIDAERHSPLGARVWRVVGVGLRFAVGVGVWCHAVGVGLRFAVGVGVWCHAVGVGRNAIKPASVSGPRSGK